MRMNIQKYILPEWESQIGNSNLPEELQVLYMKVGMSMAEFLDRKMMRKLPEDWFSEWIRYKFPLTVSSNVVEFHRIIGSEFGEFISDTRKGNGGDLTFEDDDISKLNKLRARQIEDLEVKNKKIDKIRQEMVQIRKNRNGGAKKRREKRKLTSAKQEAKLIDHDVIYEEWMEMVNKKKISKSYWHIHEYMARYILDFAKKHNPKTGELTKELVEQFLEEYGKGKRPKTMNHYNRVARYFWEFYDKQTKS